MAENNQDEFQAALMTEFDVTPPVDDTTPPAPTPVEGEENGGEDTTPPAAQAQVTPKDDKTPPEGEPGKPEGGEGEEPKPGEATDIPKETAEEKANREAVEAANGEDSKPLTAEDIKKVLAEDRSSTQERITQVHSAREEIISKLHPEGIDQKIYDTNGNVIKTAQDIVDRGLINDRTGEPYTYDEASSFMLEAGRQMAENVEKLNNWAEGIAELNVNLKESNFRVMDKWGDVLSAMPNLAKELAEKYITKQLEFDETGSYTTKVSMTPEEFYDTVMPPYRKLAEAIAEKNANNANAEEEQIKQQEEEQRIAKENEQAERMGLPPQRGQSSAKSNTGDEHLDALVDELNKG